MTATRGTWAAAGLVSGLAGLAVSHVVGLLVTVHESPVVVVGEWSRDVVPSGLDLVADGVAEPIAALVGAAGRLLLVGIPLAVVVGALAWAGVLAARSLPAAYAVQTGLAVLGGLVVLDRAGATTFDLLPVALGWAVWMLLLAHLRWLLSRPHRDGRAGVSRRGFLLESGRCSPCPQGSWWVDGCSPAGPGACTRCGRCCGSPASPSRPFPVG